MCTHFGSFWGCSPRWQLDPWLRELFESFSVQRSESLSCKHIRPQPWTESTTAQCCLWGVAVSHTQMRLGDAGCCHLAHLQRVPARWPPLVALCSWQMQAERVKPDHGTGRKSRGTCGSSQGLGTSSMGKSRVHICTVGKSRSHLKTYWMALWALSCDLEDYSLAQKDGEFRRPYFLTAKDF